MNEHILFVTTGIGHSLDSYHLSLIIIEFNIFYDLKSFDNISVSFC